MIRLHRSKTSNECKNSKTGVQTGIRDVKMAIKADIKDLKIGVKELGNEMVTLKTGFKESEMERKSF